MQKFRKIMSSDNWLWFVAYLKAVVNSYSQIWTLIQAALFVGSLIISLIVPYSEYVLVPVMFITGILLIIKFVSSVHHSDKVYISPIDPINIYPDAKFALLDIKYFIWRLDDEAETHSSNLSALRGDFVIEQSHITLGDMTIYPEDIQWFGRNKASYTVRLDVYIDGVWHMLIINPNDNGEAFLNMLYKIVPEWLRKSAYMSRPDRRSMTGTWADVTTQNLQGIYEKHQTVKLYVTPLWLVVLENGRVIEQHFIDDITDIHWTKHPQALDDAMHLLSFTLNDEVFTYALTDEKFKTLLSDATRNNINHHYGQKKKQHDESP